MSWLFSQALVAEYWPASCSDGAPSAQLSVMDTPHKFWRSDKTMDALSHSRFGLTCVVLTDDRGADLLMSYLAASRARTSALPAKARASTVPAADFGDTWQGSLAKFDQASSSWRTAQPSLLADLGESLVTWPRSGLMRDGQCWERPMSEHRTSATASGSSPNGVDFFGTPLAGGGLDGGSNSRRALRKRQMYLTPTASDARPITGGDLYMTATGSVRARRSDGRSSNRGLSAQVSYIPTPTVCGNYNRKGASPTSGDGLATWVQKWPTPKARDWKAAGGGNEELSGPTCSSWWESEPDVGRMAHGVAARVDRLKAIGNGQVSVVAAIAFLELAADL